MKLPKSTLRSLITLVLGITLIWSGCKHEPIEPMDPPIYPVDCDTSNVTFNGSVLPIFEANCLGCHSGPNPNYGLDLTNFDHLAKVVKNGSLVGAINHAEGFYPMPKSGAKLSDCDIRLIEIWANDTSFTDVSCDTNNVTYKGTVLPVLAAKCFSCHSGPTPEGNLDFSDYSQLAFVAQNGALLGALRHEAGFVPMPQNGGMLDDCTIAQIEIWIRDTTFSDPGGGGDGHPCDPDTVYFRNEILPLIKSTCATTNCHDKLTEEQDVLLIDYASIIEYGKIKPGNPEDSELFEKIVETDPEDRMPPPPISPLSADQINLISTWIAQGAKDNFCDEECDTTNVTFSGTVWPIIQTNCYGCHSGPQPSGNIVLADYNAVVVQAANGNLFGAISHDPNYEPMPRNSPKLADCKIEQIKIWIEDGTPNN